MLRLFLVPTQLLQEEEDAADYAAGLASDLFFYAPQDVLAGQYLYDDWDPELVGTAGCSAGAGGY